MERIWLPYSVVDQAISGPQKYTHLYGVLLPVGKSTGAVIFWRFHEVKREDGGQHPDFCVVVQFIVQIGFLVSVLVAVMFETAVHYVPRKMAADKFNCFGVTLLGGLND